ncbi:TWiK family of potassium channels protein 7-like [Pollicipes pollicipes]|uniref:TWiK family of potassium channels protein 7-like n=1 Tax=Pollicipes pollicipes TaxID=41117 RepID=UPI00188550F9|nr:TWiK family of potassium channels protein 7-like [Pollicipes pollicipes]XP_037080377.1 TWiK family of potassium channels protein 7-like [Pollicipes pollicipes]
MVANGTPAKGPDGQPLGYQEPTPFYTHLLRFLFGHVGLFFLVAGFAVVGAWMYVQIELPAEEQRYALKKVRAADINDAYNYMSSLFWHYQGKNLTFAQWDHRIKINLKTMEQFIINAVENFKYDGTVDEWNYDWTFPKALLFTITIMTTIGYGHIAPITFTGQMFTICYAMIGTPLLLVFLANVGDSMASAFTLTYSRVCCRWCRARRYQAEAGFGKKVRRLVNDQVGHEAYMPTAQVLVPITINMVLIVFYLLMGALIFSNWEGWDLGSSCYFSFVTLSTIGFGDMVPGNSFLDYKDGGGAAFKMIAITLYCVFGMALISMCIQMMQDQIVSKVHWFAAEVGIIDSDKRASRSRVKYKRSRKDQVPETPLDADGNLSQPASGERRRKKKKKRPVDPEEGADEPLAPPPAAAPAPAPAPPPALAPAPVSKVESADQLIDEEMGAVA